LSARLASAVREPLNQSGMKFSDLFLSGCRNILPVFDFTENIQFTPGWRMDNIFKQMILKILIGDDSDLKGVMERSPGSTF
jgi:hypothetical protein